MKWITCKLNLWLKTLQFIWITKWLSFGRARKLLSIRLFDDEAGKRWQKSVKDQQFEILCVSQFTLYNRLKGNKPDFHLAMQGAEASNLYNLLLEKLGSGYSADKIKGERFATGFWNRLLFFFYRQIVFLNAKCLLIRWKIWSNDASSHTKRWSSHYWNWITSKKRVEHL